MPVEIEAEDHLAIITLNRLKQEMLSAARWLQQWKLVLMNMRRTRIYGVQFCVQKEQCFLLVQT